MVREEERLWKFMHNFLIRKGEVAGIWPHSLVNMELEARLYNSEITVSPRIRYHLCCRLAHHVDDVERAVHRAGDGDSSQRGLCLHCFWAAQLMALGACYPQRQHPLCSLERREEYTRAGKVYSCKRHSCILKRIHWQAFRSVMYRWVYVKVCVYTVYLVKRNLIFW